MPRIAALALVVAALTVPASAAAQETCRGRTPTIVGSSGTITGTDGDDVIVTNGEHDVSSGGGDDVVCVTDVPEYAVVLVDAGAGADIVDTTQVTGDHAAVATVLGPGSDRFYGGPRDDAVHAGTEDSQDEDADRIVTGGGVDKVTTGEAGIVDADHVDLGRGRGYLTLMSDRSTGRLRAADGSEAYVSLWLQRAGRWVIDDRADRATREGRTRSTWPNLAVAEVHGVDRHVHMSYVGTDKPDSPRIYGHPSGARLGGGADDLTLYNLKGLNGSYLGGPGADQVRFWGEDELLVDLDKGGLGTSLDDPSARIRDFERVEAFYVGAARLVGNQARNIFVIRTCQASVIGEGGNDRLEMPGRGPACPDIPVEDRGVRVRGGSGDDVLHGSDHDDRLIGGPGRDRVFGRRGVDLCRAEVQRDCEA